MTRIHRSTLAIVFAFSATAALAAVAVAPAPTTERGTTMDVIQGKSIADPYRWLENWEDPKVQAWSDAQDARARTYFNAVPGRAAVQAELTRLITATSPAFYGLQAAGDKIYAYY